MKILIVEDEKRLHEVLINRLKKDGYQVEGCYDGNDAWKWIKEKSFDLILLDIMLPGLDGILILTNMRKNGYQTPVLFLTAKDAIEDRVRGLDLGANDYLVKPFAYEELLARIRVLMRNQKPESQDFFTLGDLTMDCSRHVVIRSGREIVLSGKEFALLEYLIRNKGIVLSKDSIAQQLWDYDYDGDDNIIKVYIRYLRRKIDDDFEVKLIHTVRNYGYVLREEE